MRWYKHIENKINAIKSLSEDSLAFNFNDKNFTDDIGFIHTLVSGVFTRKQLKKQYI